MDNDFQGIINSLSVSHMPVCRESRRVKICRWPFNMSQPAMPRLSGTVVWKPSAADHSAKRRQAALVRASTAAAPTPSIARP